MTCDECQGSMLEVDPELLRGIGSEPVAVHIRSCEACREIATAITGAVQLARTAYARIEPVALPPRYAPRLRAWLVGGAVASLAAAAAIVLVVSGRPGTPKRHLVRRNPEPDTTAASTIAVEVPDGRNAIVFDTKNPNVSVVWIY